MRKSRFIVPVLLLALLFLSACSVLIPRSGANPGDQAATQDAIIRQAVQATATMMAAQTQIASLQTQVAGISTSRPGEATLPVENPTLPPDLWTPTFTLPPTDTPTPVPSATLAPTYTPVPPTNTPIPPTFTPTATALPCNSAQFVQDVTIPDGSTLTANANFTKIWRLRNTGACAWTDTYDVVFTGGDSLGAATVLDLRGTVLPGQVIDLPIEMKAPGDAGHYRGDWKLRDSAGVVFGLGRSNTSFYVDIRVPASADFTGDFVASLCDAEWSSGAGTLSCPGANNDSRGFVYRVNNPTLETGYVDDEPALLTNPQMVTDGIIRGKYPNIRVKSGHHFLSIIGCASETSGCDVNFQLDYQIGSGSIHTLKTWHEVYDKAFTMIDVDLSSLEGKDVHFILTVLSNGSSNNDRALWLAPRIVK